MGYSYKHRVKNYFNFSVLDAFTSVQMQRVAASIFIFIYLSAKYFAKLLTILFHYLNAIRNLAKDWYHQKLKGKESYF